MGVDQMVVVVVVVMIGHTFDKLVDTLLMDKMPFDYRNHRKNYLLMVLLFHLVEIFDVVVVNVCYYHWLKKNKDFEEVRPKPIF
jgi:hypothetical protein